MFQVVTMWNLADPINNADLSEDVTNIKYRGNNPDISLTGQFATPISEKEIEPLSVSDIANKFCSTKRNLYFKKGKNKSYRRKQGKSWGRDAGRVTQSYISQIFSDYFERKNITKYSDIIKRTNKFSMGFNKSHTKDIKSLRKLAQKEYEDPERLLRLLQFNGRAELGMKLMHSILRNDDSMDYEDLALEYPGSAIKIYPDPIKIGINKPSTPDFLIEKYHAVGDIKSGVKFEDHYLLTCAGYALAYENWKRENQKNIDWGIIYFFPTRIPTDYAKPFTFAQIYIFPIDDIMRKWFLDERDLAYETIIKDSLPDFPENKKYCTRCPYIVACKEMGLVV